MTYKKSLVPDRKNHSIEIPEEFYGKKVEVLILELSDERKENLSPLPPGKKVSAKELLEHFGEAPDFPSADEIRSRAWPSKW